MSAKPSDPGRTLRKRTPVNYAEGTRKNTTKPRERKAAVGSRVRKGRTRDVGTLSNMMHVPVDIFLEIVSLLHPRDLIQVARTSKQLRSIVLSRKCRGIWRDSLGAVDGLPSCPDDMSEPAYAVLLFDSACTLCGSSPTRWVDYAIRLRLCKPCHSTNIKRGKDIIAEASLDIEDVRVRAAMARIPCEIGKHPLDAAYQAQPQSHHAIMSYYVPQLKEALSTPNRAQRKGERLEDYLDDLGTESGSLRVHNHATAVLQWVRGVAQEQQKAKEDFIANRKAIIVQKLVDLGYEESDIPNNAAWAALVEQTKELTDRIWNNLRPKLEVLLQEEKERQTRDAYKARVERRLEQLSAYYGDWVDDAVPEDRRGLMPNLYDGARLPCLRALAEANDAQCDISREDFLALTDQVVEDAEAYLARAKELAVTMLQDGIFEMPDYDPWFAELESLPADDALSRHYALFGCEERFDVCNTGILTFEELHAHWRIAHPQTAWGTAGPPELHISPKNPAELVTRIRCRGSHRIGGEMLDAVGLTRDTPRAALDELIKCGRLYCACGDPSMPPPEVLDWTKLYAHVLDYTGRFESRLDHMPKSSNSNIVLESNHLLTGPDACMKLLPRRAATAPAFARFAVDSDTRAAIEACLASRPKPEAIALCRSCRTLTARSQLKYTSVLRELTLPETPDGIAYHLRGWHAKEFEDKDVVWDTRFAV